jgi:hypothetical protein
VKFAGLSLALLFAGSLTSSSANAQSNQNSGYGVGPLTVVW